MKLGPVFLQFKVPAVLTRRYANRKEPFDPPFYRMHLYREREWQQHRLLTTLAKKERFVRYASPRFDTEKEFAGAYADLAVASRSVFVSPLALPIPLDRESHYVAYSQATHEAFYCSDPIELLDPIDGESFLAEIARALDEATRTSRQQLESTLATMRETIVETWAQESRVRAGRWQLGRPHLARDRFTLGEPPEQAINQISERPVADQIGFLAAVYFDAVALLI
jgi:hypothetical protein